MSEFIAEAQILVRPNTTGFRAELEAALAKATATPITIPVAPVLAGGLSAATAQTTAFTTAQAGAAAETQAVAAALEKEAVAATEATTAQVAHSRSLAGVSKGVVAQGASLLGLRAGTLAASSAFIAGTVAVLAFSKAVQSAAQLETELNVFRVTAGATADEMARVADEAKQLGRDLTLPGVTANDAAVALTELSKAGLSVQDSLDGARGVLQLATAAQIDNVTSTKLVAGALNSFALSGNEAVRVADLLTGAAKESQGEISDMGTALAQASAVAHLAGVSIEDTVTFLTELSKAGISGGRAGTSLRVAFLRLINPTAAAAKALKDLNVQVRDSAGDIRPQVFTDLTTALQGVSKAQAQATLATIFGTDAVRAAAIIGALGAANFDKLRASVTELGLAQEQAAARTQGLQGSVENLKNQFSTFGLTLGAAAKGPVQALVTNVTGLVGVLNEAAGGATDLGKALADLDKQRSGGFFGGLFKDLSGSPFPELTAFVKLLAQGQPVKFGELPSTTLKSLDTGKTDLAQIREEIDGIVAAGKKTGGDLGLNQTLVSLDLLSAKLREGGPEAQKFATAVTELRRKLFESQGLKLFPDDVRSLFPPELLTGQVFKEVGDKNRSALQQALNPSAFVGTAFDAISGIGFGIDAAVPGVVAKMRTAGEKIVAAAQLALGNLGEQFDVATAAGSTTGQLASLRAQAVAEQQIRDAEDARAKAIGAGNAGFATAVAKRREAQKALASLNEQIRGIEAKIVSDQKQSAADTKAAADKIRQAVKDREQALLSSQGLTREQQQNLIDQDAQKGFLGKQVADEKALRALVLKQIAAVKDRISLEGGRAAALASLRAVLTQVDGQVKALREQQLQQQKELQDSILQTQLLRAQGTPGTEDDTRVLNKQIAAAEKDRKAQQKIADNETLGSKVRLDAALKVQEDTRKILTIRQSIKSLAGGGVSLSDLFKEAINQLNEFGSNVSTAPVTAGGARAAVAGGILAQKTGLTDAEKASLNATAATNDLLAQILVAIGPPPNQAQGSPRKVFLVRESGGPEIGVATSQQQRRLGTFVGGV